LRRSWRGLPANVPSLDFAKAKALLATCAKWEEERERFASSRSSVNNSVKYESPEYAGFKLGALYGFSNQSGGFANNRAYSVGMSYVWGPLNFGAGYLHLNSAARTPGQVNTGRAVTDTTGSSLQGLQSPTAVPLGALAARQQTLGGRRELRVRPGGC
jgi:predicted porin